MYSNVLIRIGISWCAQYCVNKDRSLGVYSTVGRDRDLLFYCFYCFPTVSYAFLLFLVVFYCLRMQKLARGFAPQSLNQVHAFAFRRYIYDHQVEEAECPLCGANNQCT